MVPPWAPVTAIRAVLGWAPGISVSWKANSMPLSFASWREWRIRSSSESIPITLENEGLVRSVAPVGLSKGAGQFNVRLLPLYRPGSSTPPGPDGPHAYGVGAGGPIITGPMMSNTFIEASSGQVGIMP